jgi:hypothetical protein
LRFPHSLFSLYESLGEDQAFQQPLQTYHLGMNIRVGEITGRHDAEIGQPRHVPARRTRKQGKTAIPAPRGSAVQQPQPCVPQDLEMTFQRQENLFADSNKLLDLTPTIRLNPNTRRLPLATCSCS